MGSVYAARNQGTGKRVALKWLLAERQTDMEMIARFEREARAAGRIDHPNVVTVYDVGRDGPSSFLVMELLKGYSLYKLMKQGPIPPEPAVQLIMPVLRGIGAAHDNQVIHRDLKPENVFVCLGPDGTPRNTKVLDFGVSKMTDEMREGLSVTRTGMIIGTPYYMAPEQIRGMQDLDHRIDVYAAGVVLYEMIAGRPPFVAENYSGLVVEIATGTPPDLRELCPEVSDELAAVITRAMSRNRDERYPDARSFGEALEPFAGGVTFSLRSAEWTQKIKLPRASTPPPDHPLVLADSHAATLADTDLEASGPRKSIPDAFETSVERPQSKPDPNKGPSAAWHESEGEPPAAPEKRSRLVLPIVAAAALVLAVIVAVAAVSSGVEEEDAEPMILGEGGSVTPLEATETVADSESETETETVADSESETVADSETETVADSETETVADSESDPHRAAASSSTMTTMRRRRAATTRMTTSEAPAMQASPMMGGHRAGSLSLEDF